MTTSLDLPCKVHTHWYITILCSSIIDNTRSGHLSRTLPDPWRIILIPRTMSINNFDDTIGFVLQSTYKLLNHTFCSSKFYKSRSGHPLRTLTDPWRIFLTPRMMSISNFDHIIIFVLQSTYKWIHHTSL